MTIENFEQQLKKEMDPEATRNMVVQHERSHAKESRALVRETRSKVIETLQSLEKFDGVLSLADDGKFHRLSNTIAIANFSSEMFNIVSHARGSVDASDLLERTRREMHATLSAEGFQIQFDDYTGWKEPDDSEAVTKMNEAYKELHGVDIEFGIARGALECGILQSNIARHTGRKVMCVAMSIDIQDAHTPRESLSIPSANGAYDIVKKLLEKLAA